VSNKSIVYTKEAFDVGTITLTSGTQSCRIHVMNEYMAVEDGDGVRMATFPDVITTLDESGRPVSAGHAREGDKLHVLRIAKDVIPLSSSVKDPSVYPIAEKALGIALAAYALKDAA
jgi:hypothetical protein